MTTWRRLCASLLVAFGIVLSQFSAVFAASNAYDAKYVTSITYMNVGTDAANLSVTMYDANGTGTVDYALTNNDGSVRTIAPNASASLAVSSISSLNSDWKGGAVISANQPLAATVVQVSNDSIIKVRPVSNGFNSGDGGGTVIIPTVLKTCFADSLTTRFNVQNVSNGSTNVTVRIYWPNGNEATASPVVNGQSVSAGDVVSVDMKNVTVANAGYTPPAGCAFNGSAIITSSSGDVVASALETSTTNRYANSFEGFKGTASDGAPKVYMPSALCNINYGDGAQSTAYAIQNLANATNNVTVTYKYQLRASNGTLGSATTTTVSLAIPPGSKASVPGCQAALTSVGNSVTLSGNAMPPNAVGSAVITATGGNIVAISKVVGAGISAATPGITSGSTKVVVPYVRYSNKCFTPVPIDATCRGESRQQTRFAVQNVNADGSSTTFTMKLYDQNGVQVGSTYSSASVDAGAKLSISPANVSAVGTSNEFGYWVVNNSVVYAGSAVFESAGSIAVVARVLSMTPLGQYGEDFNGIPR